MDEVTGWKLVHGDIFRPPRYVQILTPLLGSGIQMLCMVISVVVLAAVGVLNPSYRGGFVSFGLFLFVFAGYPYRYPLMNPIWLSSFFAGYLSARLSKQFGNEAWIRNAFLVASPLRLIGSNTQTAGLIPGLAFTAMIGLNFFLIASRSSSALPFGTILALLSMWLLLHFPLVFLGALVGQRRVKLEFPRRTTVIPRQIPPLPWYLRTIPRY